MLRLRFVRSSTIAAAAFSIVPLLASAAVAQTVEGVITKVDLHGEPRQISIRQANGEEAAVRVHVSTHINFTDPQDANISPELSNLRPGMQVRAAGGTNSPATQIDVISVPSAVRTAASDPLIKRTDANADQRVARSAQSPGLAPSSASSASSANQLKVRLLTIDRTAGNVSADVAGKQRSFRVQNPSSLANFKKGDLVIVTVDDPNAANPTVTAIGLAEQTGRVTAVDPKSRTIRIAVGGGQEQTFALTAKDAQVRVGDQVSFETEERTTGEKVITKIQREQ